VERKVFLFMIIFRFIFLFTIFWKLIVVKCYSCNDNSSFKMKV